MAASTAGKVGAALRRDGTRQRVNLNPRGVKPLLHPNMRFRCCRLTLLALLACFAAAAEEPARPTVEPLFGLPQVRQPRLSPDGRKIAFLFPHEKKMALGIY